MIAFLLAVLAGYLTPLAKGRLSRPLARALPEGLKLQPGEERLAIFVLMMLAVGVLAALFHSGTPFWTILGGAIGVMATRIYAVLRDVVTGKGARRY